MAGEQAWVKIERRLEAPIEQVWEMWADRARFASWYGPNGATVSVAEMDVVVGGTRKIAMQMGAMTMWFTGEYREVEAPTRLVYTESMCDEDGNIIPPEKMGMPKGHPEVTEVIVTLQADGAATLMTMIHRGVPAGTPGEGGWIQAFGKLDNLLAR